MRLNPEISGSEPPPQWHRSDLQLLALVIGLFVGIGAFNARDALRYGMLRMRRRDWLFRAIIAGILLLGALALRMEATRFNKHHGATNLISPGGNPAAPIPAHD